MTGPAGYAVCVTLMIAVGVLATWIAAGDLASGFVGAAWATCTWFGLAVWSTTREPLT